MALAILLPFMLSKKVHAKVAKLQGEREHAQVPGYFLSSTAMDMITSFSFLHTRGESVRNFAQCHLELTFPHEGRKMDKCRLSGDFRQAGNRQSTGRTTGLAHHASKLVWHLG